MRRIVFICFMAALAPLAFGDSQNFSAGTGADGLGGGSVWNAPNNITIAGQRASSVVLKGGFSNNLLATNFGFSIPGGAIIVGVQATFSKSSSGAALDTLDNGIFLLKAGLLTGTDHSNGTFWGDAVNNIYGSGSDLWGTTLTPADVNAVNFGVSASAFNSNISIGRTAFVNAFVSMVVTYTGGGMGKRGVIQYSQTRTSGPRQSVK